MTKTDQPLQYLLIDDSEFDLFLNEELIAEGIMPGFTKTFKSAEDALKYIIDSGEELPESVILLDLMMPIMNGFEFLEEFSLLSENTKTKIKIFMLSTTVDREDIQKAKANDHIIDILSKPLNMEILKARLNYLPVVF